MDAGDGHIAKKTMNVPPAGSSAAPVPAAAFSAGATPSVRISEGPSREEFTRVPWLKIVLGLGFIGAVGMALWGILGRRRAAVPNTENAHEGATGLHAD